MSSKKQIRANRSNAQKSTGPKTLNGRKYSSRNATKHSLFSKRTSFSGEDQVFYQALLSLIQTQLRPSTPLQSIAVSDIARCSVRCTIAHRLEAQTTDSLLSRTGGEGGESSPPPAAWYGSSPQELRTARSWLTDVCADFAENHQVRDEWKPTFDLLFGPTFFVTLSDWQTMHFQDILMAEMLTAKSKRYNMELPGFDEFKKSAEGVVADPRQNEHLKEKILAIQLRHIEDLIRISQQTAQTANSRTGDFSPRYFTSTQRDFHRAVAWFFALTQLEKSKK